MLLTRVVGAPSPELVAELAGPMQAAAVLIGVIERSAGPTVLFTERALHLPRHPGQISFPGGRLHEEDADAIAAALREAHEEVGLPPGDVDVLGQLAPQLTVTGFHVTPVVGWLSGGFAARPDPTEVQSVFEVPLAHLRDPTCRQEEIRTRSGTRFVTEVYVFEGHRIWGATASILSRFLEVISE